MKTFKSAYAALMSAVVIGAVSGSAARADPLRVYSYATVLEAGPVEYAVKMIGPGTAVSGTGGVPNLWDANNKERFPGIADLAANAETQILRWSVNHTDARVIMTVAEGIYRVVGRRSSGISAIGDLKGKTIGTQVNTSAAYYLRSVLTLGGMTEADVNIVSLTPGAMADALVARRLDAIAIWEPEALRAERELADDAVILQPANAYRELFNLNAKAEDLADPDKRGQIVAFLRSMVNACETANVSPAEMQGMLAKRTGFDPGLIADSWKHHRFPCNLPVDLLDVLAEQERWLAVIDKRSPRTREELSSLIDSSVLAEATEKR